MRVVKFLLLICLCSATISAFLGQYFASSATERRLSIWNNKMHKTVLAGIQGVNTDLAITEDELLWIAREIACLGVQDSEAANVHVAKILNSYIHEELKSKKNPTCGDGDPPRKRVSYLDAQRAPIKQLVDDAKEAQKEAENLEKAAWAPTAASGVFLIVTAIIGFFGWGITNSEKKDNNESAKKTFWLALLVLIISIVGILFGWIFLLIYLCS
jgi:uncharacterized membrane protein